MRRFIIDAPSIFMGMVAALTIYLTTGFATGFHTLPAGALWLSVLSGFVGAIIPTLWEIFTSSRELARISHSWLVVGILLLAAQASASVIVDSLCFGYLFHLFKDSQNHDLAPAIQFKSCNRVLGYSIIALVYVILVIYAIYATAHPPTTLP